MRAGLKSVRDRPIPLRPTGSAFVGVASNLRCNPNGPFMGQDRTVRMSNDTHAMESKATGPTPLDAGALARLKELDPDGRHGVVHRVLTAFDGSLARMLVQLQAENPPGGGEGDPQVVASIAHTLKSSSASVGALELAAACHEVERRIRNGEPGSLPADVARMSAAGEAALVAVRAMLHA
jgi:HPt (histidine-containing phosphotransfer) domain-containing protein